MRKTKSKRRGKQKLLDDSKLSSRFTLAGTCARGGRAGTLAGGVLCLLVLAVLAPRLSAKQKPLPTKTISGAVLDQGNRGVSGASVFLTDLETHHTDALYSGPDGAYTFPGLNPHDDYQLQAKYNGLTSDTRNVSSLDTRTTVTINLVLNPSKPN